MSYPSSVSIRHWWYRVGQVLAQINRSPLARRLPSGDNQLEDTCPPSLLRQISNGDQHPDCGRSTVRTCFTWLVAALACSATAAPAAEAIRLANNPNLSPDGQLLAFDWNGD